MALEHCPSLFFYRFYFEGALARGNGGHVGNNPRLVAMTALPHLCFVF